MAAALLDRLLHRCHIVNIRGSGCRMRRYADSPKRSTRRPLGPCQPSAPAMERPCDGCPPETPGPPRGESGATGAGRAPKCQTTGCQTTPVRQLPFTRQNSMSRSSVAYRSRVAGESGWQSDPRIRLTKACRSWRWLMCSVVTCWKTWLAKSVLPPFRSWRPSTSGMSRSAALLGSLRSPRWTAELQRAHFMCSEDRTFHLLPTHAGALLRLTPTASSVPRTWDGGNNTHRCLVQPAPPEQSALS